MDQPISLEHAMYSLPNDRQALEEKLGRQRKLFDRALVGQISALFDLIEQDGDRAVVQLTQSIDGVSIPHIAVPASRVRQCEDELSPALLQAIIQARDHIREVNELLLPRSWQREIRPGTVVGEKYSPLDRVGIWIPARKGPLLSTALMLVTAAKTAGVADIVVGMPPLADGMGDPATIAAASMAGADRFVIGNGVAVIAGFCLGTASIPRVDGVFGPGPGGVAAAMSLASVHGVKSVVGLGPTECMVVADETADPELIALDLLNEAEHGPDSAAVLVTTSLDLAVRAAVRLAELIEAAAMPRREYLQRVFGPSGWGAIVVASDLNEACAFVDAIAPEHVKLIGSEHTEHESLRLIRHAGEVLLGRWTTFSAANYGIGITAVLPTNGYARAFSGITAKDMIKCSTIGKLDKQALTELLPVIRELGAYERLPAHIAAAEGSARMGSDE